MKPLNLNFEKLDPAQKRNEIIERFETLENFGRLSGIKYHRLYGYFRRAGEGCEPYKALDKEITEAYFRIDPSANKIDGAEVAKFVLDKFKDYKTAAEELGVSYKSLTYLCRNEKYVPIAKTIQTLTKIGFIP